MTAEYGTLRAGYLEKRSASLVGGWQKRWFEAVGNYLRYYKNDKKVSILAALDLRQFKVQKATDFATTGCFNICPWCVGTYFLATKCVGISNN